MTSQLPEDIPPADTPQNSQAEPELDGRQKLAALEAVLFMAAEPIAAAELAQILEVTPAQAEDLVRALDREYSGRGLQISRIAGGYQVCTRAELGSYVARLHKPERFRLSRAALETLAIVAYKQPITRPEIEAVRGVNSDSPVDTLLQYQLICEAGRKSAPGRPIVYRTTDNFLGQFGLNSVDDLPHIDAVSTDEDGVRADLSEPVGLAEREMEEPETGQVGCEGEPSDRHASPHEERPDTPEQSM